MSDDNKLAFLSEEASPTPAPEPQAAAPTPEPAAEAAPNGEGPARDDKGRFAPKAGDAAPTPEPAVAQASPAASATPEPAPAPTPDPVGELQKRLEVLERENQGLKSSITATRAKAREVKPPPEYWTAEDKAYHQAETVAIRQEAFDRLSQASFNRFAKANGEELAKQVADWAGARSEQDPRFNGRLIESDDPLETAFEVYQQDPSYQIKTLQAEIAALKGGSPNPAPAQPGASPTPAVAAPRPTTIANAVSAGGAAHVPVGDGQAYAKAFGA